jgi:hypothetical protein
MAEQLLPTVLSAQEQTEWCWAAVAAAMLEATLARRVSQCQVVSHMNRPDACARPDVNNVQGVLDEVLRVLGLDTSVVDRADMSVGAIASSIGRKLPVGARIEDRSTMQGHFVLVVGCDAASASIIAADPWGTPGTAAPRYRMPFDELRNAYGEGGWGRCSHLFVAR